MTMSKHWVRSDGRGRINEGDCGLTLVRLWQANYDSQGPLLLPLLRFGTAQKPYSITLVEIIPHGTPQPPRGGTAPDLYTPVARAGAAVHTRAARRGPRRYVHVDYRALQRGICCIIAISPNRLTIGATNSCVTCVTSALHRRPPAAARRHSTW